MGNRSMSSVAVSIPTAVAPSGHSWIPSHLSRTRSVASTPFASHIKDLRQRFGGKQWWLAHVAGCSDAAVSYWESGRRIPASDRFSRIVDALTQAGASPSELATLECSWLETRFLRCEARRAARVGRITSGPRAKQKSYVACVYRNPNDFGRSLLDDGDNDSAKMSVLTSPR